MSTSDVVIIGAGVMGCAVAWRLRQRGLSVTLIERGIPGAEASSAAAGILAPQAEAEGPGPFLELALASRALYPAWVEDLRAATGIDVGYRTEGTLVIAGAGRTEADAELGRLKERRAWQQRAGLRVALLDTAAVREVEPALAPCAGALHFPDDHQVEAPLLARALSQAAAQAGARFVTAHVQRVRHDTARVLGVSVEGEELSCGQVVIAAGSWSALVEGGAVPSQAVRPMRGQMLELDTRPPLLRHTIFGALAGPAGPSGYLVPRRDGRIVAGSTMELVGFRKEVTVAGLRRLLTLAEGLCPPLAEAEVRRTWAGFRPYTADGLPLLGATSIAGLHLCTGHHRNGILLCPISAEAISRCILGVWAPGVPPVELAPFSVSRLART
jgi:glycine oxidase